ncbi:MAG: ABC transporter substrate-binding protein [Chloroflexi bacterium]|nr:ABC transporter substrate-binding protein [Chloroflexota bacterium]
MSVKGVLAIVVVLALLMSCAPAAPTAAPAKTQPETAKPAAAATAAPKAEPAKPASPTATAAPKIKRGGTIKVAIQNEIMSMYPMLSTGPVPDESYDGLTTWEPDAKGRWGPAPGLAESWEFAGKSVTLKLRKGVKFHDGSDWNADVAKWNLVTQATHPKSIAKKNLECVDPKAIEVVDPYTLKVGFNYPCAPFLANVSNAMNESGMVSKVAQEKMGDDGLGRHPVGTGPFEFVEWLPNDHHTVKRFDGYWRKGADGKSLPYIDGITFRFIADDSVRLLEVKSGNVDFTELIQGKDVPGVKASPDLVFVETPYMGNKYRFVFNAKSEPFGNDLKLRQAAQYAMDREAMAKTLGMGAGTASKYDFAPGGLGYDESVPYYGYDVNKAKQLVKDSSKPAGVDILLTVISRQIDQQQAQMMKQMLDAVGIRTEIEAMERIAWGKKVREGGQFQMATQRTNYEPDPDAPLTLTWASEGQAAYSRASVPEMDKCLQEGRETYDPAARQQVYVKCQKIMFETAWWGFMWSQGWNYVYNKRIKGFPPSWASKWRFDQIWLE